MPIVVQPGIPTPAVTGQQTYLDDLVYRLVRDCGDTPPDSVLVWRWLRDRYRRIWGACSWSFAQKEYQVITTAAISSDSVTVTKGSATVTETTSDSKWTTAVIGRKFRASPDSTWYTISNYSNANPDTLTLDRVYEGTSATLAGYKIFQDTYSLSSDTGEITALLDTTRGFPLEQISLQESDRMYPGRATSGGPFMWALAGMDTSNIPKIQFYPIPSESHGYLVRYIQQPPYLVSGSSVIIPQVFESLLVNGWKADYWGWRSTLSTPSPSGAEQGWYGTYEMAFMRELNEMVAREYRSSVPTKLHLHPRYTWHRALRSNKFGSRHYFWELP